MSSVAVPYPSDAQRPVPDTHLVAEYCSSCKAVHFPAEVGTGQKCQKAAVAVAAEPLYAAEAAMRKAHGETAPGKRKEDKATLPADRPEALQANRKKEARQRESRERAAKTAGTSGRSVARFKRVQEQAPDLAEKVRTGEMALDRAERVVRDREAEARRIEQARREAAAQPEPTVVDIRHGDFREVLADLRGVDAVITDPPYPGEFLPLLDDLAAWADKVLAPDGVLAVLGACRPYPTQAVGAWSRFRHPSRRMVMP